DWIIASNGHPAVTDFLVFWLAGHSAVKGAAAAAYVPQLLHSAEAAAAGHGFAGQLPWRYAPIFLFVVAPLALLPYLAAFLVWVVATLALYAAVVSRIAGSRLALLLACAAPAVFINAICGQNGPLTAALIGAVLLCLEERPILSGVLLGLLSYKPQFGILFPFLLIAGGHWRALIAAALATLASVLVSCLVFGAGTFAAFLHFLPITSNALLIHGANGFNKLQTVYGLMRWLGFGNAAAWMAQSALILATAAALVWLWRRRDVPYTLKAAAAAAAILLATPHLYAYDFAVLSVTFAFLYRERPFDAVELAGVAAANLCVGAFLFFPTPIGLAAIALAVALIVRRVLAVRAVSTPDSCVPACRAHAVARQAHA
ncbi:MAG: glycosyltransferase family 87 protein, partial [Rhizomicrobium sp.]